MSQDGQGHGLDFGHGAGAIIERNEYGASTLVGDFFNGQKRLNIVLRSEDWDTPEELASIPFATPEAGVQAIGELTNIVRTAGPSQIRRVDRRRTITLRVTPPADMSLEEAVKALREKAEPAILDALPESGNVTYRGTAEELTKAITNLSQSFALRAAASSWT